MDGVSDDMGVNHCAGGALCDSAYSTWPRAERSTAYGRSWVFPTSNQTVHA